jgi:hypothetical protein
VILLGLLAERLVFTSVKVKVELDPGFLHASQYSQLNMTVYPANTLGFKTPFAKAEVRYDIVEGGNLIELVNSDNAGMVIVKSKGKEGEAIVGIYSLKSGMELYKILIKIVPKDVA